MAPKTVNSTASSSATATITRRITSFRLKSTRRIAILESKISELLGSSGTLSSECADLKAGMSENEAARKEAASLREKQHETFVKDEEDMRTAIGQMNEAIEVLSEIGGAQ